jgi:transcription elongation factor GreA
MTMDKIPMTREGYLKMESEFLHMKSVELKECLQNLTDARDKGDLSENAEYEVAKQALNDLNDKMSRVNKILANCQIIEGVIDDGTVQLLTWVSFKNLKSGKETEYRIVPEHEINLKEGKISPYSPIGKALMGNRVGEEIEVNIPAGKLKIQITKIRII